MFAEESRIGRGIEQYPTHFHKSGASVLKDLTMLSNALASSFVQVPTR